MKRVAVVILNWNGKEFLKKFLPRVIEYSSDVADIILADNASKDDSVSFLRENFPQVDIIENDINYGFADGYNKALSKVNSEYYVLLNSDIEVSENWIEPIIEVMDSDVTIAACQPKIRSYHEPEKFEYAGAAGGYIDKYGYPFCRGRIFQHIENDLGQYDDATEIFWATGACMFVRARHYHEYGGLDGDFFAHMEEIDFCWRLKNHGYKIMYCPKSLVFHVGGGTLPKISSRKTYLNFRNNLTLLYKNLTGRRLFFIFFVRFFLDMIASLKFLTEGDIKDFWAVIRAWGSFCRKIPRTWKKRKKLNHRYVSKVYKGNIVLDYYLLKKREFDKLDTGKFT